MHEDKRDLLAVLKFELHFLENGGYAPRAPWRRRFVFEDSPSCMNYESKENRAPCSACILMHFVPPDHRTDRIPCRHIPLDGTGETLDSLCRYGGQREMEEAVGKWLRATIHRLEGERKVLPSDEIKK